MTNYTEHKLVELTASAIDPSCIAILFWIEGRVGTTRWASRPTGTTVPTGMESDTDYVEAIIRQQLPNANIEIRGLRRERPIP